MSTFIIYSNLYYTAFSKFTAHTLYSGILHFGSKAALVNIFAAPSAKWNGMNTTESYTISLTFAFTVMVPLLEVTFTLSPSLMPSLAAVSGFIST